MRLFEIPLLGIVIPLVSAHGRITNITAEGVSYEGWDPEMAFSNTTIPPLAAWSASNLGNIFVSPSSFNTTNITCHFNAKPGALHVNVTAGNTVKLQWNEWPVSHKGPVLTYLAACNTSCANVDKSKLNFVKVDQQGFLNSSEPGNFTNLGGTWASDVLIANKFSWTVKIPDTLEAGTYVLRHEIIALHVADEADGAQAYPQCVNLRVATKDAGVVAPTPGIQATRFYKANDPGILLDIHKGVKKYQIPGPQLWADADPMKQGNENR